MPAEFNQLYYEAERPEVLPFVPTRVTRHLDVGCAAGGFAATVKGSRRCESWGIELNPEMAERARARLDQVFSGDAMAHMANLPSTHFDLITFNDVLEHLAQPDQALAEARRLLAPGGVVVASVPNIRYWPALMTIVKGGDFPWADEGIFDRTHLRFFTRTSAVRLFTSSGFEVSRCEGINFLEGKKLRLVNLLTRGKFEDSRWMQFVIVASAK
ncbi:MAG: class I SAM-dependent methyltransferase [Chthonomonas sp.]|nr:class I SAM-dependent methyltransferase [Chthonomonas sp.]